MAFLVCLNTCALLLTDWLQYNILPELQIHLPHQGLRHVCQEVRRSRVGMSRAIRGRRCGRAAWARLVIPQWTRACGVSGPSLPLCPCMNPRHASPAFTLPWRMTPC